MAIEKEQLLLDQQILNERLAWADQGHETEGDEPELQALNDGATDADLEESFGLEGGQAGTSASAFEVDHSRRKGERDPDVKSATELAGNVSRTLLKRRAASEGEKASEPSKPLLPGHQLSLKEVLL